MAAPVFKSDIPSEHWLQDKLRWTQEDGRNQWGVPKTFGPITGAFDRPLNLPVSVLLGVPGERGEQRNVRAKSLAYIREHFEQVTQEPVYIEVDPYGQAWMSEGNHRIMVAAERGVTHLESQVRYFTGAERVATDFSPERLIALDAQFVQEQDMEKINTLASDLSRIALGEMYSEKVVKASVERLQTLRDQEGGHPDPVVTQERVNQALVACKLALHGVVDVHHKLQDAAVVIALADGQDAELLASKHLPLAATDDPIFQAQMQGLREVTKAINDGMRPEAMELAATDDPIFQAQMQGLRDVTKAINDGLRPEVMEADFKEAKLKEFGDDVGLTFDKVQQFDDGSRWAGFSREVDGLHHHVALALSKDYEITLHTAIGRGDSILAEGEPQPRDNALSALDAAIASFDQLRAKVPLAEARTQAEAQALAARVAAEQGATLGEWVQSAAKEWVGSTLTAEDGRAIRVSASTGGVVSVNGDPFTPHERTLNVTHEAVSESIRTAIHHAPAPLIPLKTDHVFASAPGELGEAWAAMCEEENRLAGYLTTLKDGTAVVVDEDAWYLEKADEHLVLMHGEVSDGKVENARSRFQFDLDWVDVEVEDLRSYTALVKSVADDFLIDPALWKTMSVEPEESPSLGM